MDYITEVSAAGILAVILLKTVFDFIKSRDEAQARGQAVDSDECGEGLARLAAMDDSLAQMAASTAAITELCSKVDSGGLPLIYRDNQATTRLTSTLEALNRSVERLSDKVS